jgi:hypothetical protein
MRLEFYRDADGVPGARGQGHGRRLAAFLAGDLQDSPESAREVLRAIDSVETGRAPSWERTGNAHTLTLTPRGAEIQSEVEENAAPSHVPLSELREQVTDWLAFLEDKRESGPGA